MKKYLILICLQVMALSALIAQSTPKPGAENLSAYLPLLKGKTVAVFANHTAVVGQENVVDVLAKKGVKIKVIFGPEHGFRGDADAGQKIDNYVDRATGIPVVSLYGKKRKPSSDDLEGVDVMIFDIQDVGVRFYTYISSLEEYMQSALDADIPLIILDRPNPNGHYVDGPVLDKKYKSFVGMQSVPVVYGMTIGEYGKMLYGEHWVERVMLPNAKYAPAKFTLTVIPCSQYTHRDAYTLPVKPSPNLPNLSAIYWYPSTCYFEGTVLSEGRGTDKPFMLFGHPDLPKSLHAFTPKGIPGAMNPKLKDRLCYGWDVSNTPEAIRKQLGNQINLHYLLQAYQLYPQKDSFFLRPKSGKMEDYFFNKLVGNSDLMMQIQRGESEADIRRSWQPGIQAFKQIRKKYLIYPDFE
jgi:uncharacterized protein YbbC (DUF1343 family)